MKMVPPKNLARGTGRAVTGGGILLAALALLMFLRHGPGTSPETSGKPSDEAETSAANAMLDSRGESTPGISKSLSNGESSADAAASTDATTFLNQWTPEEQAALRGGVLTVEIDDYRFLLEYETGESPLKVERPLERLVDLAKAVSGDSNGLRVRIREVATTRQRAELDLRKALADAGVSENAIHTTRFSTTGEQE
ncbi:MAG: hypothetical protein KDA85_22055 [Planctomycetaceae bacterium]|nr:hypothetical protein [Planctomycetaceae bacterium]